MGYSQGIVPLVGYNFGAKNFERMRAIIKTAFIMDAIAMAVCTAIGLAAVNIYVMFMEQTEYYHCLQIFLNGHFVGILFVTLEFLGVGVMTAMGKGELPLFFAFIRKIVLEIAFILFLDWLLPKYGIAFSQTATEVVMCVMVLLTLRNLLLKEIPKNNQ